MEQQRPRMAIGVAGLDEILAGGLIPQRTYLARGGPGTGKTTLGLHFLLADQPEDALMATLGEAEADIRDNAARMNLALDRVPVLDLSPMAEDASAQESYSLLESWEVEGEAVHDRILEYARAHRPRRILIDSITTLRYLTPDAFQFRRQVLSLIRQLESDGATVLLTAQIAADIGDDDLLSISDGVLHLENVPGGRACQVLKLRGSDFVDGRHYYNLTAGGMVIYPRLIPGEHGRAYTSEPVPSGVAGLDEMTHGGIERGTVTIVSGPTGAGKTSLATHFMKAAADRGERSVIYSFDERFGTFATRSEQMNLPVCDMIARGNLVFEEIEPLRYNPDQFAANVRHEVEQRGASIVMLDSLAGYERSIRGEDLVDRVHALCRYLGNMGVTVIVINEVHSIEADALLVTESGISYLADSVILLRYLEAEGELRKCIAVLKKRTGDFEKTLREFEFTDAGLATSPPIAGVVGVLRGVPQYTDAKPARMTT